MLDKGDSGPVWLKQPEVADVVQEAIHHRDQKEYDLYAYSIMANHVQLVFRLLDQNENNGESKEYMVTAVLKPLKWYTALKCNQLLKRNEAFWQAESYDHIIRDAKELENAFAIP